MILIPQYGLMGAAFSTYCFAWVGNIVIAAVGQKLYRIAYDWSTIVLLQIHIVVSMVSILILRSFPVGTTLLYSVKFFLVALFALIGMRARIVSWKNFRKLLAAFCKPSHDPIPQYL